MTVDVRFAHARVVLRRCLACGRSLLKISRHRCLFLPAEDEVSAPEQPFATYFGGKVDQVIADMQRVADVYRCDLRVERDDTSFSVKFFVTGSERGRAALRNVLLSQGHHETCLSLQVGIASACDCKAEAMPETAG